MYKNIVDLNQLLFNLKLKISHTYLIIFTDNDNLEDI